MNNKNPTTFFYNFCVHNSCENVINVISNQNLNHYKPISCRLLKTYSFKHFQTQIELILKSLLSS